MTVERVVVGAKVLDSSATELHVVVGEPSRDRRAVTPGQTEHLVVEIDADHSPLGADDLRRDVADLAGARSEIEHRFSGREMAGRVAAAVVALENLRRNRLEVAGVVVDRATKRSLGSAGRSHVALEDFAFDVDSVASRSIHSPPPVPSREQQHYSRSSVKTASGTPICAVAIACLALSTPPAFAEGMPYALFDRLPPTRVSIAGGDVDIAFAAGDLEVPKERVVGWISDAARAVGAYYGRLPVDRVRVLVIPGSGRGIRNGTTFGYGGAAIKVTVGRHTRACDLPRDWIIAHEMVHLALPQMADEHDWLDEGIATYVEPLGRAQTGQIPAEKVWADLVWGLPKGLPGP